MTGDRAEIVVAARLSSMLEADLVVGMLRADGIPATVSRDDAGGLHPQLQLTDGVRVLVNAPDLARARHLLSRASAGEPR